MLDLDLPGDQIRLVSIRFGVSESPGSGRGPNRLRRRPRRDPGPPGQGQGQLVPQHGGAGSPGGSGNPGRPQFDARRRRQNQRRVQGQNSKRNLPKGQGLYRRENRRNGQNCVVRRLESIRAHAQVSSGNRNLLFRMGGSH